MSDDIFDPARYIAQAQADAAQLTASHADTANLEVLQRIKRQLETAEKLMLSNRELAAATSKVETDPDDPYAKRSLSATRRARARIEFHMNQNAGYYDRLGRAPLKQVTPRRRANKS